MVLATFASTLQTEERLQCVEELGPRIDVTLCFQLNLDSVYSMMMVVSMIGGIVESVRWQRTFHIVILTHHLE